MEKALISFSFDDGRGDNLQVIRDIMLPMEIPVTLNVTTGYVDGTCPADLLPTSKDPLCIDDVVMLARDPMVEIALHGDRHQNTQSDIAAGRKKLIEWLQLPEDQSFGFASPGSGLPVEDFSSGDSALFARQITYHRTSLRIQRMRILRVLCRKAGRILHIPLLYRIAYRDTLMNTAADRTIYSIPVMKDTTYPQLKSMIDLAVRKKMALTLMFHSIVENTGAEDNWSWDKLQFCKLCGYLTQKRNEGALQLLTTQQLYDKLRG